MTDRRAQVKIVRGAIVPDLGIVIRINLLIGEYTQYSSIKDSCSDELMLTTFEGKNNDGHHMDNLYISSDLIILHTLLTGNADIKDID